MKLLTEKELLIMNLLWTDGPMFVKELIEHLPNPKPHFNTVSTFIRILEQKKYVSHEKLGNSYRYYPILSKEDYSRMALRNFIDCYFNGSPKDLIRTLVKEEQLSDDDIWDLMTEMRNSRKRN